MRHKKATDMGADPDITHRRSEGKLCGLSFAYTCTHTHTVRLSES